MTESHHAIWIPALTRQALGAQTKKDSDYKNSTDNDRDLVLFLILEYHFRPVLLAPSVKGRDERKISFTWKVRFAHTTAYFSDR
jgi:hypothetical protein